MFLIIGLSTYPTTYLFFRKFYDIGWGLSKALGLLILSYIFFIVNTLHILSFSQLNVVFILFIIAIVNLALIKKHKKVFVKSLKEKWRILVAQEFLFALVF